MQERYSFKFKKREIQFAFERLSDALGASEIASEYMLMHFDTETSKYGFKHYATRDYINLGCSLNGNSSVWTIT